MIRRLALAAITLPLAACGGPAPAQPRAAAAKPACTFAMPAGLAGAASWLGGCRAGRAEGPGVVRVAAPGGGSPVLWFGAMAAGRPGRGVVSRNGDYYPQAGDDRAANVQAFDAAAAGARGAARMLAARGNAASARWYSGEAVKLERTLD